MVQLAEGNTPRSPEIRQLAPAVFGWWGHLLAPGILARLVVAMLACLCGSPPAHALGEPWWTPYESYQCPAQRMYGGSPSGAMAAWIAKAESCPHTEGATWRLMGCRITQVGLVAAAAECQVFYQDPVNWRMGFVSDVAVGKSCAGVPGAVYDAASTDCQCPAGQVADAAGTACIVGSGPGAVPPAICTRESGVAAGNPILPGTAEKFRQESDFEDASPAPLHFERIYRSNRGLDASRAAGPLGKTWTHNHGTSLLANATQATIVRPDDTQRSFTKPQGSATWSAVDNADALAQNADGSWSWRDAQEDATYLFDAAGLLQTRTERNGWTTRYAYDPSQRLASVTNAFGRSLRLAYSANGQLATVTTPGNTVIAYGFDAAGRLTGVTYSGNQARGFLYEDVALPHALTGIADETGTRYASFRYDGAGRAISTELAGGADRYQVSYPAADQAIVTDPLGTSRSYRYAAAGNRLAVLSADKPAENGQQDAASRTQDADGLVTSETDFNGSTTSRTWDSTRRVPTSQTRATGRPEAQTTTTQWHPAWRLPVLVREIGASGTALRSTAFSYDTSGNLLSETVTDLATNSSRTRRWAYNAQGLLASMSDARGNTWTFGYDAQGNRTRITNPLQQTTTLGYDAAGNVTSRSQPDGTTTTYTYDARQRLQSQTTAGQTTSYTYRPTGQLLRASFCVTPECVTGLLPSPVENRTIEQIECDLEDRAKKNACKKVCKRVLSVGVKVPVVPGVVCKVVCPKHY